MLPLDYGRPLNLDYQRSVYRKGFNNHEWMQYEWEINELISRQKTSPETTSSGIQIRVILVIQAIEYFLYSIIMFFRYSY